MSGIAWSAEERGDEAVCQYWQKRTAVESDWVHQMQWYGPTGSPIWIGQCEKCGWVDGHELAERIAKLRDEWVAELGASNASLIRRVADLESQLAEAEPVVAAAKAVREAESASPYLGVGPETLELIAAVDAYDAAGKGETDPGAASDQTDGDSGMDGSHKCLRCGANFHGPLNHFWQGGEDGRG